MLSFLNIALPDSVNANCLFRKKPAQTQPQMTQMTCAERYAEFLGCKQEPIAIQRMSLAHGAQALYAMASEASSVVLPYINSSVGGNIQTFAQMQSLASISQLLGGLFFGQSADQFGTRWALLTAHAAAMSSAFLVATARTQRSLFLAMVPLTMAHGFQASSQIAVHCSEPENRSVAMGRVSASYGLGFFAGTLVTAYAAQIFSPRQIAWGAVALEASVISSVLVLYPQGCDTMAEPQPASSFREILKRPHVLSLVLSKVAISTAGGMLLSMVTQFAMDPFNFSTAQTSILMAYVGGLQLLSQTFVVPQLGSLKPRELRVSSTASLLVPLVGLSVFGSTPMGYCMWMGPLAAAGYGGNTALGSLMSCLAPESESGSMVALGLAPLSLGFMVSPLLSSWVYQSFGFRMVPAAAAAMLCCAAAVIEIIDYEEPVPPEDEIPDSDDQDTTEPVSAEMAP